MDRLILVAEPSDGAYIEGSIDNVVLSVPAALNNATPGADTGTVIAKSSPSENVSGQAGFTAEYHHHYRKLLYQSAFLLLL